MAFYCAAGLGMKAAVASPEQCLMQQLQQSYATEVCRQYFNLLESMFQPPQVAPAPPTTVEVVKPKPEEPLFTVPSYPVSQLYLSIESELPEPAYKERGFSLTLALRDSLGNVVTPPSQLYFKISVCTQETEPKELTHNVSGKRILRGTIEERVSRDGTLTFPNIVITEVSSRHVGGCFSLLVFPSLSAPVQTLVIPKVTVKARRAIKQ
eukprot:CAMPEP_0204907002 /NCGR_PEP_ID=MMETSP1397-20131031/6271_1 /ASSEMBLY_ACC=CAM_ASM_000891 /TAXON_ID=49980 /ORGANISM="Climacostomum Climacostomum virens, Strain Stock W-24" /LENGTH=208 /DNA_ID=CAMNT_0052076015 /DNA_START=406 /DNA_END=1032 /DNA_ORIENTATION=-